jgi:tetratricopeptide (TPR) repeat protein
MEKYDDYMKMSKEAVKCDVVSNLAIVKKFKKMGDLYKSKKLYEQANENYQQVIDILSPPSQGEVRLTAQRKEFGGDFIETIFEMADTLVLTNDIDKCLTLSLVGLDSALRMQTASETEIYMLPNHVQYCKQILRRNLDLHSRVLEDLTKELLMSKDQQQQQQPQQDTAARRLTLLIRRCHFNIGTLHFHLQSYPLALTAYQSCFEMLSEEEKKETFFAAQLFLEIGRTHDAMRARANGLESYAHGLPLIDRLVNEKKLARASDRFTCQNLLTQYYLFMARYYHLGKEYAKGIELFQRSLKSHAQAGENSDLNRFKLKTIYCYIVDSDWNSPVKNWDRAIEYERLILEIEIEDAPQRHLDESVGTCYKILSKFYAEKKDFERARENYIKYSEIDLISNPSGKLRHEKEIAEFYGKAGLFNQQLDIYTKNLVGMVERNEQYSVLCEKACDTYLAMNVPATALEYLQKAIRSSTLISGENTRRVADFFQKCADIAQQMGESEKSAEFLKISQERRAAIPVSPLPFMTPMPDTPMGKTVSQAAAMKTEIPMSAPKSSNPAPFLSPMPDSAVLMTPPKSSNPAPFLSPMPDSAVLMTPPKSSSAQSTSSSIAPVFLSPLHDSSDAIALSAPKSSLVEVVPKTTPSSLSDSCDLFLSLSDDVFRLLLECFSYEILQKIVLVNARFARVAVAVLSDKPVILLNGFYQSSADQLFRFYDDHYAIGVGLGKCQYDDEGYRKIFKWFKRPYNDGNGVWISSSTKEELGTVSWTITYEMGMVKYTAFSEFGERLNVRFHSFINGRQGEATFKFIKYDFEANALK